MSLYPSWSSIETGLTQAVLGPRCICWADGPSDYCCNNEPLEIGAGYAFGVWEGTGLCLLGALVGSALVFILVRSLGSKVAYAFFSHD